MLVIGFCICLCLYVCINYQANLLTVIKILSLKSCNEQYIVFKKEEHSFLAISIFIFPKFQLVPANLPSHNHNPFMNPPLANTYLTRNNVLRIITRVASLFLPYGGLPLIFLLLKQPLSNQLILLFVVIKNLFMP